MPHKFFNNVSRIIARIISFICCWFRKEEEPETAVSMPPEECFEPTHPFFRMADIPTPWLPTIEQRIAALDLGTLNFDPQVYQVNSFANLANTITAKASSVDNSANSNSAKASSVDNSANSNSAKASSVDNSANSNSAKVSSADNAANTNSFAPNFLHTIQTVDQSKRCINISEYAHAVGIIVASVDSTWERN